MFHQEVSQIVSIQPARQLDAVAASGLRQQLVRMLAEGPCDLTIDLSHVTRIDSAGIAVLLSGLALSERSGSRLSLVWPTSRMANETLRRAAFHDVFDLDQSREVVIRELSLQ